jgi:membrane protein implicated in regulation of membrane protease activity
MCFETLHNGDATELPVRELFRAEAGSAVKTTGIAAVAAGLFLLVSGVATPIVAAAALTAVAVGFLVHMAVLAAGVAVVRWRATGAKRRRPDRPTP